MKKKTPNKKVSLNLVILPRTKQALAKMAAANHRSISAHIDYIVERETKTAA